MTYYTATLPCGLRIIHTPTTHAVSYCGFMLNTGTRHESVPALYGMAHFIEHMLFKGTQKRNAWHISNRMEAVGGELNAFTTKEDTTFYSAFLTADFERACELLCDLICHPTAPQAELQREREVVIDEINSYRDNPPELIYDEFEELLFAGHPLGHNILGNEQTVRSFDSTMCLDFIARRYRPSETIFFSCGATPWQQVLRCVEKYYDRTEPSVVAASAEACATGCAVQLPSTATLHEPHVIEQETHQAHVMLGTHSYPIGSPHAAALALINNMLGGPGMNSRLNQALREKRGLVYTVESSLTNYTDCGLFSIYFGCDHHDVHHCLQLTLSQLKAFRDHALSAQQLHAAQKQLIGQLGVATANLESTAITPAKGLLRLGAPESLEETCRRVEAVTAQEVLEVANELLTEERMRCVIIR
jgi:predicted Zn-dependent peptidase